VLQNRDQLKSALEPFGQVMYVDYPDGAEEYVDNDDVVVDLFDFDVDFAEVLCVLIECYCLKQTMMWLKQRKLKDSATKSSSLTTKPNRIICFLPIISDY